jgi:hypothetical protein
MPGSENNILWYPMRVTYHRELKIKAALDTLQMENFLPMRYELVSSDGLPREELVPAIHNLIFIRSSKAELTALKQMNDIFEPLRFMTRPVRHGVVQNEIIRVPDREMENFIRVASVQDGTVKFLENTDYIHMVGKNVRITGGVFQGVEGVIKRIKNNKQVVVRIQGVAAVAIAYIPAVFIQEI